MTDKEILKKALEKAIKNGYKDTYDYLELLNGGDYYNWKVCGLDAYNDGQYEEYNHFSVRDIIFSHEFAKAFWGEEDNIYKGICECDCYSVYYFTWQHHLREMILEEEPLKYLEKFL